MKQNDEQRSEARQMPEAKEQRYPLCPTCAAFPRFTHVILDPVRGKTVRLYQCCGDRVWEDEVAPVRPPVQPGSRFSS